MSFGAVAGAVIGGGLSYAASREQSKAANRPTTSTQSPWAGQQQHLVDGFAGANAGWKDAITTGVYHGDRVADLNSTQMGAFGNIMGGANTQRAQGSMLGYQGQRNIGNIGQAGVNANGIMQRAQVDPTGRIIQNGAQFANNPYMDQMVDAASRDVTRNLNENQMTALDLGASGSGNMNSSRTGVAQGIMQRGAADRIGDISAGLRGAAYSQGMNMSQDQYNANMQQQLTANGQVLDTGKAGAEAMGAGQGMVNQAGQLQMGLGDKWQDQHQSEIDASKGYHDEKRMDRLNMSGQYLNAVNGNFGGTTVSQGPRVSNGIQSALSGAMGGMGLYGQMKQQGMFSPSSAASGPLPSGYAAHQAQFSNPWGG